MSPSPRARSRRSAPRSARHARSGTWRAGSWCPGSIDLHTHVYWGGTSLGVDADAYAKPSGITTVVDAGSAGPGNIAGFRRHVIERAEVRIRPFLHIAFPGIFGLSKYFHVGESGDLRLLNARGLRGCRARARGHRGRHQGAARHDRVRHVRHRRDGHRARGGGGGRPAADDASRLPAAASPGGDGAAAPRRHPRPIASAPSPTRR